MELSQPGQSLIVTDFSWLWGAIGFPLGVTFVAALVRHVVRGGRPSELVAILFGLVLSWTAALVLTQRAEFRFDAHARKVFWSRRSLVRSTQGVIPFDHVRCAVVQYMSGGGPPASGGSYRVALATRFGVVPLTTSYDVGRPRDAACREVRSAINRLLGVSLAVSEDDNDILELHRSGQRLWASRLAQDRYRLSTTEAHHYVNDLVGD